MLVRLALVLPLLLNCAPVCCGQSAGDSLVVCFTIAEAQVLDDTLWYAHGLRREYAAFRGMLYNREIALDSAKAHIARLERAYFSQQEAFPVLQAINTRLEGELSACRGRRGRFWGGFALGLGVMGGAVAAVSLTK